MNTVSPLYLQVSHLRIQPMVDGNVQPQLVESKDAKPQTMEGQLYIY